MRAFIFSDLHLHPYRQFTSLEGGMNSRREEILERLKEIVSIINRPEYDVGLFAGDFFHERLYVDVVSVAKAKEVLGPLTKPLLMCSGTHDRTYSGHTSLRVFTSLNPRLSKSETLIHVDEVVEYPVRGESPWTFVAVPHMRMDKQMEAIREYGRKPRSVLITHGDILGASYGGHVVEEGLDLDVLSELYTFVVIGHSHNGGGPVSAYRNILVPGACIPHGFGDADLGRAWDISLIQPSHKPVIIGSTPITWEFPQFLTEDISGIGVGRVQLSPRHYYRLILNPDDKPDIRPLDARYILSYSRRETPFERASVDGSAFSHSDLVRRYSELGAQSGLGVEGLARLGELLASDVDLQVVYDFLEEQTFE